MRLTILGSCGGYPEPGRACSGYLLESPEASIWIDAGTGTLDAMLRIMSLDDLDCILISHLHADHWTDLPIALHLLAVTSGGNVKRPIPIYGPPDWSRQTGVAGQWYSLNQPVYTSYPLDSGTTIQVGDLEIGVTEVQHGMPVFAMRVTDGHTTLVYSADTSPCESLVEIARNADLFLCEATLPTGQETPISMNPEQAARTATASSASHLVLTHLLPGVDPDASCQAAGQFFSGQVSHATPGKVFQIGAPG